MTDNQVILFFISCVTISLIIWIKIGLFNKLFYNIKYVFKSKKYLK